MATVPKAVIPHDPIPGDPKPLSQSAIEILSSGPFSLREVAIGNFDEFFNSIIEQNALTPEQQISLGEAIKESVQKRDRVGAFLARIDLEAEALRTEEKRFADRRRQFEKIGECFRSSLKAQLEDWGVVKVEGRQFSFTIKKNPPAVEITNEAELDAKYIDYKPQVNKSAVKLDLQNGQAVNGARLTQGTRLEIK
jgi:hypothetical protein